MGRNWPHEIEEGNTQVKRVGYDFQQRWVAIVAKDALQKSSQCALLIDKRVHVPDMLNKYWEISSLLELVNTVSEESSCEGY